MSTLMALLLDVDPANTSSVAADLRAGLVAINQQVQTELSSLEWSLNSWWQWLDDEGYDRQALLQPLQRLCAARIDAQAMAKLVEACRSRGDEPGGLRLLQVLLMQADEDLPEQLHRLEALALAEAQELDQTAGGGMLVSKGGGPSWLVKGVLISSAVGATIYAGHHEIQYRKVKEQFDAYLNAAKADARHDVSEFQGDVLEAEGKLFRDFTTNPQEFIGKLAQADQEVWDGARDMSQYGVRDIELRAVRLTADHMAEFASRGLEQALLDRAKNTAGFRTQIFRAIRKEPGFKDVDDWAAKNPGLFARAESKMLEGGGNEWMKNMVLTLRKRGDDSVILAEERKKAYTRFCGVVSDQVAVAKQKALDTLTNPNYFDAADDAVRTTEKNLRADLSIVIDKGENELLEGEQIFKDDIAAAGRDAT